MKVYLKELLQKIDIIDFKGDRNTFINEIKALGDEGVTENALFWCSDKNKAGLLGLKKGVALISQESYNFLISEKDELAISYIIVSKPRLVFMEILNLFFVKKPKYGKICTSVIIDASVKYDKSEVNIGSNVVIEEDVVLGKKVMIGHNSVIRSGTVVGDNVNIGSNNTIGGDGFGFEKNKDGEYDFIPHLGNVVIKNNVVIGNNNCIDRAVLGSTIIGSNVKIDNLVHIAHGVQIKDNSLIIAHAMVAGSVEIGENVWVSPSSSIMQKVKIGDNALVGMGSVVLKDVEKSNVVAGVPAKVIKS